MTAELLAPAGDFDTALAAFSAGADAVYCGLADFSARAFAKNLSCDDLANLVAYARAHKKRVYVTFNTLVDEDQCDAAFDTLAHLAEIAPHALIVQDLGIARLCRRHFPSLELHASTQLVAHNLEGVLALKELGFRRVVLARELSLDEIRLIAPRCGTRTILDDGRSELELECFIHGALCYSISGLCLYGAMEKGRSGNRGQCPYGCRTCHAGQYPFSMKDLRVGEDAPKLVAAGVTSLKIEGRMKSALYVASVTRYYRDILDKAPRRLTPADLETVFSRRTTSLYLNGTPQEPPIDTTSLGHVGTEIGTIKRVTKDCDGNSYLRFHTCRALEKHDGLQFAAMTDEGRHLGMGIVEMRTALSRHPVCAVAAGTDVEILLSDDIAAQLKPGMAVYCSMSNAVKRQFPIPSFRPSDYAIGKAIDVRVEIAADAVRASASGASVAIAGSFAPARDRGKTAEAVRKAFAKLGGTGYWLKGMEVVDAQGLFVPPRVLNDLRRDLVEKLSEHDAASVPSARSGDESVCAATSAAAKRSLKIRMGQTIPPGDWDEIVVAADAADSSEEALGALSHETAALRLALPVYTTEPKFPHLRTLVKRLLRAGYARWEASDLATLRLLRGLGIEDITADWTLYAFNAEALAALAERGVKAFVASPENNRENLQYLGESGYAVTFLAQQSTPLFISRTEPGEAALAGMSDYRAYRREDLWVTTRAAPRTFTVPSGAATRIDLSWDPS